MPIVVFGDVGRRIAQRAVVLGEALERLPGQVQPVPAGIAALQQGHHAQALRVVVEAAERLHRQVERVLPGVAERRVAEVVGQRQRLGQVLVQRQFAGDRAGDLRHLDRMGQPRAVEVALVVDEHLGLVLQLAERGRMDDAVAVALERRARRRLRLRMQPPPRRAGMHGIRRQGGTTCHGARAYTPRSMASIPCRDALSCQAWNSSR